MRSASVNTTSLRFPRKCPHCGRKAEGTCAISAMRGLDVFLGGYAVPPLIDVPVCGEVFQRRRTAAVVALVSTLAFMIIGAIATVALAIKGVWLAAAVLGAAVAAIAAGGRTGWDAALLDQVMLGVHARAESSTRVRVCFKRDEYFRLWAAANPSASEAGAPPGNVR